MLNLNLHVLERELEGDDDIAVEFWLVTRKPLYLINILDAKPGWKNSSFYFERTELLGEKILRPVRPNKVVCCVSIAARVFGTWS